MRAGGKVREEGKVGCWGGETRKGLVRLKWGVAAPNRLVSNHNNCNYFIYLPIKLFIVCLFHWSESLSVVGPHPSPKGLADTPPSQENKLRKTSGLIQWTGHCILCSRLEASTGNRPRFSFNQLLGFSGSADRG